MNTARATPHLPVRRVLLDPNPRWYETSALRFAVLLAIGLAGALGVYLWCLLLEALAP
jgi:hypothetical protein